MGQITQNWPKSAIDVPKWPKAPSTVQGFWSRHNPRYIFYGAAHILGGVRNSDDEHLLGGGRHLVKGAVHFRLTAFLPICRPSHYSLFMFSGNLLLLHFFLYFNADLVPRKSDKESNTTPVCCPAVDSS